MSGRELSEWQAYLMLDVQVQIQIQQGMDAGLADRMVWSSPDDEDDEPVPKRKPKGKG